MSAVINRLLGCSCLMAIPIPAPLIIRASNPKKMASIPKMGISEKSSVIIPKMIPAVPNPLERD